jgi:hypothetical protein
LKKISSASAHSSKLVATVMRCAFCCTVSRHGLNFADTLVVLKRSIIFAWHTSQNNSLLLSYFPDNYSLIWSHQITHFCYKLFTSARRTSRPLVTFCHISTNIHTSSRRRNNSNLRTAHCLLSQCSSKPLMTISSCFLEFGPKFDTPSQLRSLGHNEKDTRHKSYKSLAMIPCDVMAEARSRWLGMCRNMSRHSHKSSVSMWRKVLQKWTQFGYVLIRRRTRYNLMC